jgi:hypothetical protein
MISAQRFARVRLLLAVLAVVFGAALAEDEPASADADRVVTDIASWTHPTKAVFASSRATLRRVELHRGGTYPVFFVSGPSLGPVATRAFAAKLSAANGWWSSEIRHVTAAGLADVGQSASAEGDIDVDEVVVLTTKRAGRTVSVRPLLSADAALDRAAKALGADAARSVVVNGERVSFTLMLESPPAVPFTAPGWWSVSLGEDHTDHRVTIRRVDVDASTGAVWEVDPVEGTRTKRLLR